MNTHEATIKWRRRSHEIFTDQLYSRVHDWTFDGGATVRASASPHGVRPPLSDPSGVDPEEALVAALSSCHMLFFLSLAARAGFTVRFYEDNAIGYMGSGENGSEWLAKVILRPLVAFEGDNLPRNAEIRTLHENSHRRCYIANSVKTEVIIDAAPAEGPGFGISALE